MQPIEESELILNARGAIYHLNLLPEELARKIFLVGDPGRVPVVSKYFDRIETKQEHREFISHTGYIGSEKFTVVVIPHLRKTAVLGRVTMLGVGHQRPFPEKGANLPNYWWYELSTACPDLQRMRKFMRNSQSIGRFATIAVENCGKCGRSIVKCERPSRFVALIHKRLDGVLESLVNEAPLLKEECAH